jgi:hypothetical protein
MLSGGGRFIGRVLFQGISKLQEKWWPSDDEAGLVGVAGSSNVLSNLSANHLASREAHASSMSRHPEVTVIPLLNYSLAF